MLNWKMKNVTLTKKRKNETVEKKRPWAKNKKAAMLGLVHEADKKFIGKNINGLN